MGRLDQDDKETTSISADELDVLIAESARPPPLVEGDTTSTIPATEIDRLIAQGRSEMVTDPGPIHEVKPPPIAVSLEEEARAPSRPPSIVAIAPPPPPPPSPPNEASNAQAWKPRPEMPTPPNIMPEELRSTLQVPIVEIPEEARRSAPPAAPPTDLDLALNEADLALGARRKRMAGIIIVAVLSLAALIFVARLASFDPKSELEDDTPPAPVPTVAEEPTAPAPVPTHAAVPAPEAARAPAKAEADARAALERFKDGLRECARHVIGVLPGSSPAVPPALDALKGEGFVASATDWKTPVWSCTKFHIEGPMRFALQWQATKPGAEGTGVAWIDGDGDGKIELVLGFHVTMKAHGDPVIGDVGALDAATPILAVH